MKKVMGGTIGPPPGEPIDSTCSTTCKCPTGYKLRAGMTFTISSRCNGDCVAINETSVTCGNDITTCSSQKDTYCEMISI